MEINSLLSSVSGYQSIASIPVKVLDKAQDIAVSQANQLINAIPTKTSNPDIGQNIDIIA